MKSWSEQGHAVVVPPPPPSPSATVIAPPPSARQPPPPPGSPAPPGPAPAVAIKLNGFAVTSMVLGIFGAFALPALLAVIFGHIALAQIRQAKGWQRGTGIALAGVILGWSFLAVFLIALIFEPVTLMSIAATMVEYRLDEWEVDARDALGSLLRTGAVPHEWRGAALLVPEGFGATVDGCIGVLEPPPVSVDRSVEPGWYIDPIGQDSWRWWDGHRWLADGATAAVRTRPWVPARADHDHAVRGGVLAFVGWIVSIALGYGFASLAIALGADEDSLLVLCIGQAGLWAGMFGTCVIVARRNRIGLRGLGLARLRGSDWGSGALTAFVARVARTVVALVFVLIFPLHSFRRTTNAPTNGIEPSITAAIVLVLIVCVGAPFFEELFFRGVVQGALTRRWGARIAIVTQAFAFALVHYRIGMTLALTLATWGQIAVAGFFLGVLRWRYERLGPGMIAHGLFNALAIAVLLANWL